MKMIRASVVLAVFAIAGSLPALSQAPVVYNVDLAERDHHEMGVEVRFGMGNDTLARVASSEEYYARWSLEFGPQQARALERLLPRILVFGRSRQSPGDLVVEPDVREISSTLVRERTRRLWSERADDHAWQAALGDLVSPAVLTLIRSHGLYAREP